MGGGRWAVGGLQGSVGSRPDSSLLRLVQILQCHGHGLHALLGGSHALLLTRLSEHDGGERCLCAAMLS